jgi:hypothetical protein
MIIGFEWIKEKDFQRKYSYDQPEENPYTPILQGELYGFEWNAETDSQQQYGCMELEPNPYEQLDQGVLLGFEWQKDTDSQQQYSRATTRYLFEDDGEIKKFEGENLDLSNDILEKSSSSKKKIVTPLKFSEDIAISKVEITDLQSAAKVRGIITDENMNIIWESDNLVEPNIKGSYIFTFPSVQLNAKELYGFGFSLTPSASVKFSISKGTFDQTYQFISKDISVSSTSIFKGSEGKSTVIFMESESGVFSQWGEASGKYVSLAMKISQSKWVVICDSPATESIFLEQGMDRLDDLNTNISTLSIPLEEQGELGEGKLYKAKLNKKGITINSEAEVD